MSHYQGGHVVDEISAHIGKYLQVRPKAAHSGVRTEGLGVDGPTSVLPLGFYLRPSFTEQILLEHIGYNETPLEIYLKK